MQEIWETCWQNCIKRILDDIIGAHAYTVSRKHFEYIVFRDIKNMKEKSFGKLPFYRHLIITQNLNKLKIKQCLIFSVFKKLLPFYSIKNKCP